MKFMPAVVYDDKRAHASVSGFGLCRGSGVPTSIRPPSYLFLKDGPKS